MLSQLTVKGRLRRRWTWAVDASVSGGKLTATATTKVKDVDVRDRSDQHRGSRQHLRRTSTLTMKLTALDPSKFQIATTIAAPRVGRRVRRTSPSFASGDHARACRRTARRATNPGQVGAGALVARHRRRRGQGLRRHRFGRRAPGTCRRGRPRPTESRLLNAKAASTRRRIRRARAVVEGRRVPSTYPPTPRSGPKGGPEGSRTAPRCHACGCRRPYAGSLSVPNDYRCFVLDPHFTKPQPSSPATR